MRAPEKRVNENNIMLVAAYPFGLRKGTFKETSDFGLLLLAHHSLLCRIAEAWILFIVFHIHAVYFGNLQRQQQL